MKYKVILGFIAAITSAPALADVGQSPEQTDIALMVEYAKLSDVYGNCLTGDLTKEQMDHHLIYIDEKLKELVQKHGYIMVQRVFTQDATLRLMEACFWPRR